MSASSAAISQALLLLPTITTFLPPYLNRASSDLRTHTPVVSTLRNARNATNVTNMQRNDRHHFYPCVSVVASLAFFLRTYLAFIAFVLLPCVLSLRRCVSCVKKVRKDLALRVLRCVGGNNRPPRFSALI